MDYRATFMMGVVLTLLFALPFFCVWRTKHPSRSLVKECACFFAVLYGIPFAAGFFLGNMLDFNASVLSQLFQLDLQVSAVLAKTSVSLMAVLVSLPLVYIARKTMQTPIARRREPGERALMTRPELSHRQSV